MCIVIDINTLPMVFISSNARHADFLPIKEWIDSGGGFMLYGGKKYKEELRNGPLFRLIRLMRDAGRALAVNDKTVDELEQQVIIKTAGTNCDDQHVIALLGASRCSLLCSLDERSYEFIQNKNLYPKNSPKVKIYRSSRNEDLLKKVDCKKISNLETNKTR